MRSCCDDRQMVQLVATACGTRVISSVQQQQQHSHQHQHRNQHQHSADSNRTTSNCLNESVESKPSDQIVKQDSGV